MASHYKQIETFCPHCKSLQVLSSSSTLSLHKCTHCAKTVLPNCSEVFLMEEKLNQCAACGCANLYRQKDFNKPLGVAILVIGIGLSYFTYGISLLFVTVLDLLLYFKVKEVAVCYECSAVYRGFNGIPKLEPFQLVLYDHYRINC